MRNFSIVIALLLVLLMTLVYSTYRRRQWSCGKHEIIHLCPLLLKLTIWTTASSCEVAVQQQMGSYESNNNEDDYTLGSEGEIIEDGETEDVSTRK